MSKVTLKVKRFDELTTTELYELLRARAEVFVVEQNCVYQDLDGIDYKSIHVFFEDNGRVMACLRIFEKENGIVQIGRVLTIRRGVGLGGKLLKEGVRQADAIFRPEKIYLESQCYAIGFYEREGFKVCSEEITVDGLPHVRMISERPHHESKSKAK